MEDQIVTQVKKYLNSNKKTLWTILVTAIVTMVAFYKFSSLNVAFISSPHNVKLEINDEFEQDDSLNYLDQTTFVPQRPKYIAIHCTDSYPYLSKADLDKIFKERSRELGGKPGYNYAIDYKGQVLTFRGVDETPYLESKELVSGVKGKNQITISIAIIGGRNKYFQSIPPFNQEQLLSLYRMLVKFKKQFPDIQVVGHRDLISKDLNKNGKIDPQEYVKTCPNFDVSDFFY